MTRDEILAMEPGREMDALVAEVVFGRPPAYYHCPHFDENGRMLAFCACPNLPRHSTDIAAAWQVVEKLYDDGWIVSVGTLAQEPRGYRCELCNMWEDEFEKCPTDIEANGSTASEAICKDALLATLEASK